MFAWYWAGTCRATLPCSTLHPRSCEWPTPRKRSTARSDRRGRTRRNDSTMQGHRSGDDLGVLHSGRQRMVTVAQLGSRLKWFAVVTALAVLSGCGGGGDNTCTTDP